MNFLAFLLGFMWLTLWCTFPDNPPTTLNSNPPPPPLFILLVLTCALVYQVINFNTYIWEQHLYRTLLICLLGFAEKSSYGNRIRINKGHCFRMGCFLIVWEFVNCDWDLCLIFFFFFFFKKKGKRKKGVKRRKRMRKEESTRYNNVPGIYLYASFVLVELVSS